MEIKLILLKSISLEYYRSHTNSGKTNSVELLMTQLLEMIKFPEEQDDGMARERNHLAKLRSLLLWMSRNGEDKVYELTDLLSRIRVACGDDDRLYELFRSELKPVGPDGDDNKVAELVSELTTTVAMEDLVSLMRQASRQVAFDRDRIEDISEWRAELMSKMEALPLEGRRRSSKIARMVDVEDIDDVAEIFEAAQAHIDPKMILPFPYQGLNDMTGPQQGLRRGDWSVHCALPGRNKTGVLIDTFCCWATLGKPHTLNEKMRPTLVYVTIEDQVEVVFQKFYTVLKQIDTGLPVKVVGVPFKEMAKYVRDKFLENGWAMKVFHFPVGGHPEDYLQLFRDLEDDGYEVAGVVCDYVNLIGKKGIPAVVSGDEIKYLHRKIRGYFAARAITHMTVHQLGPKAKELFRIEPMDYIRKLPGQGAFEGVSSLDTEPDFMFYIDKVQSGRGGWWQQFQFEKHRRIGTLPDHLKYFAQPFQPFPMMSCDWDVLRDKPNAYDRVGAMKPRPKPNWDTLAEIDASTADPTAKDGVDDDMDSFDF